MIENNTNDENQDGISSSDLNISVDKSNDFIFIEKTNITSDKIKINDGYITNNGLVFDKETNTTSIINKENLILKENLVSTNQITENTLEDTKSYITSPLDIDNSDNSISNNIPLSANINDKNNILPEKNQETIKIDSVKKKKKKKGKRKKKARKRKERRKKNLK
tara:strand:- start:1504 stop:1998 length:495 start_codon:yes stop_codon:yes gene_type:complete